MIIGEKMRQTIYLILILMSSLILHGEKTITLTEISKPNLIEISDMKLYIMEGSKIFAYDLDSKKLLKTFCKKGEGPGELKLTRGVPNFLLTTTDSIIAISMDKAIKYSKEGKLIKEQKIPRFTNYLYPVKNGYIGMKMSMGKAAKVKVIMFDKELKEKKILYIQNFSRENNLIDLTPDGVNIAVDNNKLYIEESAKGFEISVFDLNGILQKRIKKSVPKIKFTDKYKEEGLNKIKNNPFIKQIGWDNFKKRAKIIHQDYIPFIQDMVVNNSKIYIKTYKTKGEKVEFLVLDNTGKELKKVFLPKPMETDFLSKLFGRFNRFYKFYNDTYYYLIENEEDEEWELHSIKI